MTQGTLPLFGTPKQATMHFDGGSRGNPGPAAWGYTLVDPDGVMIAAAGRTIGTATNNEAEYGGLIAGLQRAHELGIGKLMVRGDSKLVIEQMAGNWKVKAPGLQGLHREARLVAAKIGDVEYAHVRRGANALADQLVNAALDSDDGTADDRALQASSEA